MERPTVFTENLNVNITQNKFTIRELPNIGTIVAPELVHITINMFEDQKAAKFASDVYFQVEHQIHGEELFAIIQVELENRSLRTIYRVWSMEKWSGITDFSNKVTETIQYDIYSMYSKNIGKEHSTI